MKPKKWHVTLLLFCLFLFTSTLVAQTTQPTQPENFLDNQVESTLDTIRTIWNLKVFEVKGNVVKVSQIVLAFIMLTVGFLVSKWLTAKFENYLLNRVRVDLNTAAFIRRILYYVLIVIIVLSTLQMIQIPITMFTFLGGAIAIAFGFGAQNIFNNFISGMILMIEKPVRIGDIVEIESDTGTVEEIGARSTRFRRNDGIEVLVPNSKLLESNLINRTLSDKLVRAKINVGVAYGSDVEKVKEVLVEIISNNSNVLDNPVPDVLFEEFGDSALIFNSYFWLDVERLMGMRRITSDIRFEINRRFAEEGIVIAFPQQDIHMDASSPIPVYVQDQAKKESSDQSSV